MLIVVAVGVVILLFYLLLNAMAISQPGMYSAMAMGRCALHIYPRQQFSHRIIYLFCFFLPELALWSRSR